MSNESRLAEILLVEDNPGDIMLTKEAFNDSKFRNNLNVITTGDMALDYLFKRNGYESAVTPDIILLDLNLPGTDGHGVLQEMRNCEVLKLIPVVVLTSSSAEVDVLGSYSHQANCHIMKPVNATKFVEVVHNIENFWVDVVCLPSIHKN